MNYVEWLREPIEVDVSTNTHPNAIMLIDRRDLLMLRSIGVRKIGAVRGNKDNTVTYAQCTKIPRIHRFLLGLNEGEEGDHKNRNGLDNRRCNLRICSSLENNRNVGLRKDSTSRIKGVSKHKASGKWEAYIRVDKVRKHLGLFNTKAYAGLIRRLAEIEYFKEFAYEAETVR